MSSCIICYTCMGFFEGQSVMRLTETIVLCFAIACFAYYKAEVKKEEVKQESQQQEYRNK